MVLVFIDNNPYQVDERQNLLQICLSLGFDLPYFCWHPALGSVGACRQCAVKQFKDENDQRGRLTMACMTPAAEGLRISVTDPEAKDFRARMIELLMTNHPHDCPVCEEGGECHLQDMTVMTGHVYRRYRFLKRTFENQYLGPFINHEMNRCITCYRCVRFYREYAGGSDLHALAAHNHVYFGRHEDGVLENEFSGNLVEVCPTGVFTDKTYGEHYVRKWDLQTAPSICPHCALGCNTFANARYGTVRRILNRYHSDINGYFLCDRGRFGYGFVNSEQRIRQPQLRLGRRPSRENVSKEASLRHLGSLLTEESRIVGIGSPRASLEANFALRTLVGAQQFALGLTAKERRSLTLAADILRRSPARSPSLGEVERADAIFVLGEDLTNTAPRLALALRQAVRQRAFSLADELGIPRWQDAAVRDAAQSTRSPLFMMTADATQLDDIAAATYRGAPTDVARLGFAVAHRLNPAAPAVPDLPNGLQALVAEIAGALQRAERPLIIAGMGSASEEILRAAANVAWALASNRGSQGAEVYLSLVGHECNGLGLGLLGGNDLDEMLARIPEEGVDALVVLETDLFRRAESAAVERALRAARQVVVIDHHAHGTVEQADVVLPAGTFAEAGGTLVNTEGRAQRFFEVLPPPGDVQASWRWLRDLMAAVGRDEADGWQRLDDVTAACARAIPEFAAVTEAAPSAGFRIEGLRAPRASHRDSGRTALHAHVNVHEPKPAVDIDSPLTFSMEGYYGGRLPGALLPYLWTPGWNSVQALNKFQDEVGGRLRQGAGGQRLIKPQATTSTAYFDDIPSPFVPREGAWWVIPSYHIFGSEELSRMAPAIAARAPAPYFALNVEDATGLGITPGTIAVLQFGDITHRLPLILRPALPDGVAELPSGLPGLEGLRLPAWAEIMPEATL